MIPTTANELQQILEDRKLYPWHAAANGTEPLEGYVMTKKGDRWIVYLGGREGIINPEYFTDERKAVEAMIKRLRADAFASYLEDL